jgi:hypothetical protein
MGFWVKIPPIIRIVQIRDDLRVKIPGVSGMHMLISFVGLHAFLICIVISFRPP